MGVPRQGTGLALQRRRLLIESVVLIEAVRLTEGVVGMVVRRMVKSAITVVLAEKTIPVKRHPSHSLKREFFDGHHL